MITPPILYENTSENCDITQRPRTLVWDTTRNALRYKTRDGEFVYITGGEEPVPPITSGDLTGDSVLTIYIGLKETTAPTVLSGYGKIWTQSDNKLYFQDGDGVTHEIAFV